MKARRPILGELVTFVNRRGLGISGILYGQRRGATTVIHVHGSFGNFYANNFVPLMARTYAQAGINFLSINTSGHDGIAEGDRKGELEYVGGGRSSFNECVPDIHAAVTFA